MPWKNTQTFKIIYYLFIVYQCEHTSHGALLVARAQPVGVSTLLPPCGTNWVIRIDVKGFYPLKPSHWP